VAVQAWAAILKNMSSMPPRGLLDGVLCLVLMLAVSLLDVVVWAWLN
jgi:hypothetical protein